MSKILIILLSLSFGQRTAMFTVDDNTLWTINMLNVTYLNPALSSDTFSSHLERATVLKLHTLLGEVEKGRYPQFKANNIIKLTESYVALRKSRKEAIQQINESMEVYLGNTK